MHNDNDFDPNPRPPSYSKLSAAPPPAPSLLDKAKAWYAGRESGSYDSLGGAECGANRDTSAQEQQQQLHLPPASRRVAGWPTEPQELKKRGRVHIVHGLGDAVAIAATIPFLVLGGYVASRKGEIVDVEEWGKLQSATSMVVTVFPIVFSAVIGRMTRAVATWRMERGVPLGKLEQLFLSSTVFSTVSTQFLIGSLNWLAVGLLCLWALSPLGGQSSLHIIKTEPRADVSKIDLSTFNSEKLSFFEVSGDAAVHVSTLNALYITSLMAPERVKDSPIDTWGNVKVPQISMLSPGPHAKNDSGWYKVDPKSDDIAYSSLVGVPVIGVSPEGNTTFNMESSYFDLQCHSLNLSHPLPMTHNFTFDMEDDGPLKIVKPSDDSFIGSDGSSSCPTRYCQLSFSIGFSHFVENQPFPEPGIFYDSSVNETTFPNDANLLFQSRYWAGEGDDSTVALCSVNRTYVESAVTCVGDPSLLREPRCSVTAIRNSLLPHPTPEAVPFYFGGMFVWFSSYLATSLGQGRKSTATLTERYIGNPANPLLTSDTDLPLYDLPRSVFSHRLSQIINTYYFASLLPEGITGNLSSSLAAPSYAAYKVNSTRPVGGVAATHRHDVYVTSTIWLLVFLVSSLTMFVAAVLSAVLRYVTLIPDILGYASSLTRDAVYVALPRGGSTLDGLQRARLLRNRLVRFGDVRGGGFRDDREDRESVGYLAFADLEGTERADRGRKYW